MRKNKPKYIALYEKLKSDIISGIYPQGAKLPSKRDIAAREQLSLISVEHTYELLADEGYITPRERSGYYVTYNGGNYGTTTPTPIRPSNNLHIADTTLSSSIMEKAMRFVISEYGEQLLQKSPNNGLPELRQVLAEYLSRTRGMRVTPAQIIIGSGAEYLYSIIAQMMGRRTFALENPSYDMICRVYESNGVHCDMLTMGDDGILSSELERTDATVLHCTPFMSYPSGVCATASKKAEYIRWAEKRDGVIVEDDFGSEFTVSHKAEDTLMSLNPDGNIIYINTFSKTIAPSLRVGYAVLSPSMCDMYNKKTGFYSCSVPVFEQLLIAHLISNGDFERHINRVRRKLKDK